VGERGSCCDLMSKSALPTFSSKSFIVSGLTFKSLVHLEFIFVYADRSVYCLLFFKSNVILKNTSILFTVCLISRAGKTGEISAKE